ncbi:membrane-spanning 4-domains subfamily A member 5-like [Hyperolius riggenbachi]|uniref:membrane-spanning 4-domains subfamily A member 5-like n=1 Tax=Hyperolius riggenbachi TaxID=752182 RepID=UPI0035A2C55F
MDLPATPNYRPFLVAQRETKLFPVVPKDQEYYKIFLNGHPKILGAVQITLVLLQFSLGALLTVSLQVFPSSSIVATSGIPYWASLLYLVSGVLCVTVGVKPSLILVKWTFVSCIISCLSSFIQLCFICADLNGIDYFFCNDLAECYSFSGSILKDAKSIALGFMFIATAGQFAIFIYLLFMGKEALCQNVDHTPQVCVINNEYKYFVSPGTTLPGSENPNYIPGDIGDKPSDDKI